MPLCDARRGKITARDNSGLAADIHCTAADKPRPSPAVRRIGSLWQVAVLGLLVLPVLGACDRVQQERKETAALKQELVAIQAYSVASERANAAHRNVIAAFEVANRSANLPDYRRALRDQVLPRMDTFLAGLAAMPTGTATLRRIHGQLTADYRKARADIAAFEQGLDSADGLGRFVPIRDALQAGVRAYRKDLDAYYRAHDRQLRLDATVPKAAGAAVPQSAGDTAVSAGAATATAAP